MLTEDDDSQHGEKTKYARGAGDRGLYKFLRRSLDEGTRNVGKIRSYLQQAGHRFGGAAKLSRLQRQWLDEIYI